MKVAELQGAALDYWVAQAEGRRPTITAQLTYMPSTDWAHGGPIIEREKIEISYIDHECWYARVNPNAVEPYGLQHQEGGTPLIAAMRAYVASKFGDEFQ